MKNKIICINNDLYPLSLIVNKEYEFVKENEEYFIIMDENFEEHKYEKKLFKEVE
jgi:hypothetical protein